MAELTYRNSEAAQTNSYECDSTQSSMVLDQLRVVEDPREYTVDYEKCSVLHCAKCSAVLADSLGVCGEVRNINAIICLRVTQDVKVKAKFEACIHGALAYCTYKILECGVCSRCVGVVLHSTPPCLSSLRNLFLLRKEALNCYLLKTSTLVKASKVSFEIRPVRKDILELKDVLEAQLKQVNILKEEVSRSVQARASDSHASTFAD
ncbi:hypothetical protein NFI96_020179 [Prochilodus magdalenae]|nr:hypothetical protein NFI96_020179 [Prochilodus magdalenae]